MQRNQAEQLDLDDPLARLKSQFILPEHSIYLCGHSLGPLPKQTPSDVQRVIADEWGAYAANSWDRCQWIQWPQNLGSAFAKLIGAESTEVIVSDSTSVNLFKLLAASLAKQAPRSIILTDQSDFPTDLYIADAVAQMLPGVRVIRTSYSDLDKHLNEQVAIVLMSHVNYRSAQLYPMKKITHAAHQVGALMLWDLSHSVGITPIAVNECQVDLAIGCTYKYANGGPGAPAFLFVSHALQNLLYSPLAGWMSHQNPFAFDPYYTAAPGINRFLCGTPSILSMAALPAALAIFAQTNLSAIRQKSLALSELLLSLLQNQCPKLQLLSPLQSIGRGGHLAFTHPEAQIIFKALAQSQIICDFRPPDLLRFGLAPLYVSYTEVWDTAQTLIKVTNSKTLN